MFCNYCGAALPDGSTFCSHCGKELVPVATSPYAPPAAPVYDATATPYPYDTPVQAPPYPDFASQIPYPNAPYPAPRPIYPAPVTKQASGSHKTLWALAISATAIYALYLLLLVCLNHMHYESAEPIYSFLVRFYDYLFEPSVYIILAVFGYAVLKYRFTTALWFALPIVGAGFTYNIYYHLLFDSTLSFSDIWRFFYTPMLFGIVFGLCKLIALAKKPMKNLFFSAGILCLIIVAAEILMICFDELIFAYGIKYLYDCLSEYWPHYVITVPLAVGLLHFVYRNESTTKGE